MFGTSLQKNSLFVWDISQCKCDLVCCLPWATATISDPHWETILYLECHLVSCCTPGKDISSWTHTTCMRWGILIPHSSFSSPALKRFSWTLWHDQTLECFSIGNWGHSSDLGPIRQAKSMWVGPDLTALVLAAKTTKTSLVGTVGNSGMPGCGFGPSNYFYSVNPHIPFDVMHCLMQSCRVVIRGCGYTAGRLEWKDLQLLQVHLRMPWHRYTLMPSSRGLTAVVTAGLQQDILRKLHRMSLWGNLGLVWTQTPGFCSTCPATRRRLQFCLQDQRQWHSAYGTGPSERSVVPPYTETPACAHTLLGAQHLRPYRSAQFQGPDPWSQLQLGYRVRGYTNGIRAVRSNPNSMGAIL